MAEDDEEARKKRAEELRRAIDEAGESRPSSPREFTNEEARKAAEEQEEPDEKE
jgi:hypothetical protein